MRKVTSEKEERFQMDAVDIIISCTAAAITSSGS